MVGENVNAALTVAVPAARVFAVLADSTSHAAIDRAGWNQEPVDRAPLTGVGQIVRMAMHHAMHHAVHPDGDYEVVNKVQVVDPRCATGWMTGQDKGDGQPEFDGWRWRDDLARLGSSETGVTPSCDWPAAPRYIRHRASRSGGPRR